MSLKNRPMALIGFTMLLVLLICVYAFEELAIISIALGVVLLVVTSVFKKIREQVFPFFLASALLLSGGMYFLSDAKAVEMQRMSDETKVLCGRICDEVSYNGSRYYYTLDKVTLDSVKINSRVKLSLPEEIEADEFDNITVEKVKTYSVGKTNDSAKLYYHSKDIYLGAYPDEEETFSVSVYPCEKKPLGYYFLRMNKAISYRVLDKVEGEYGAITVAMLTGNKSHMSDKTVEMYTDAGVAPLFAVSGFHLSLWVMGLYEILRIFGVRRRTNSLIAIITTLCFMALTGFSASVCRAGIMMLVMLAGNLFYRKSDSVNSIGFACIIMCIINPMNASNIGFLLSVTATLGIVVLYPLADKYLLSKLPEGMTFSVIKAILSIVLVCITATIGVLPATILFIGKISLMSVFTNVAVSFVAGFCMLFGGLTVLLYPVGFLSDACAYLCEYTAKYVYNVIDFIYSLDVSPLPTADIYWHAGAVLCTAVVVFSLAFDKKLRSKIVCVSLSVVIATCGVLSFLHYDRLTQIDILNVGGSVMMIASDSTGKVVLCNEAGYEYYADDTIDRLSQLKGDSAELLLVPTYEASIDSKVVSLVNNYQFNNIITPFLSQEIKRISDSQTYVCNSKTVEVLDSGTINYLNDENFSIALCCFDTVRILVLFDCNKKAEIPEDYLSADILVCAASIPKCVDVTAYDEVIVSAGQSRCETIREYVNENGIAALTTAENGNINIQIKNQDYKIIAEEGV